MPKSPFPVKKAAASKAASPIKADRVSVTTKGGNERSVSIRQIDNGYVTTESTWDRKGNYSTKETFSAKAPMVQIEPRAKK